MPYAPDLAGSAIDGRYELHELIGEGTFGRVYRGLDRRLQRPVAIKVIKPWWAEDPEWVERFEREAQLLARVSDPGIVQIYDVGQSEEGLFYVAELVEGESLAERLRRGPLTPAQACGIAEELCRALAHTHARGVVHRDIKPANVLLSRAGRVKLGDFSLARLASASSHGPATLAGTPKYMAPEQARGAAATPATDVYSVGVVLYEMLCGQPPFQDGSPVEMALHHLQDPPPALPGHVPPAVSLVVLRALAKAPERRFGDAGEMADALAAARPGAGPLPAPAARPTTPTAVTAARPAGSPAGGVARTRVAPALGRRRNVNPAARRRAGALLVAVAGLALTMAGAALLIGRPVRVSVPALRGLNRTGAVTRLRHAHLKADFVRHWSSAPVGTVIAQDPGAGQRTDEDSVVRVSLSAGPAPVRLPRLVGEPGHTAAATVTHLGLKVSMSSTPALGTPPGTVVSQAPAGGTEVPAHSGVGLVLAQAPRWRPVTAFSGTDAGSSGAFRIRGHRWRVVYSMSYAGTCLWVFVCSGPAAHVRGDGGQQADFNLSDGGTQTRTVSTGPGVYRIEISPGDDTASWSFQVQDWY